MEIREASDTELNDVLRVEKEAFGYDKEANLVKDLLGDSSAKPYFSFLAFSDDRAVGIYCLPRHNWKVLNMTYPYRSWLP